MPTVWISKYALSDGVLEEEAEPFEDGETLITVRASHFSQYYHYGDWHLTRDAAVAKAEQMRIKRIASLEKQLAVLKAKRFA